MGKFLLSLASLFLISDVSWALVSGQLLVGLRNGKVKGDGDSNALKGNELVLAGHVDPIPLVPVSFGLSLISDIYQDVDDLKGWQSMSVVPEVMAWFPIGDFKPYGRLGYSVYSSYSGKIKNDSPTGGDISTAWRGNGPRYGVGVKWSIIPLIAVMAEYNMVQENLKATKADLNGVDVKDSIGSMKAESSAFLIGVEAGI